MEHIKFLVKGISSWRINLHFPIFWPIKLHERAVWGLPFFPYQHLHKEISILPTCDMQRQ